MNSNSIVYEPISIQKEPGGAFFGFAHQAGVAPMTATLSRALALAGDAAAASGAGAGAGVGAGVGAGAGAGAGGRRPLPAGLRAQPLSSIGLLSLVRADESALAQALGGARGAGAAVLFFGTYA